MEHKENSQADAAMAESSKPHDVQEDSSPRVTKRSPRMLHESSFATSGLTSGGGSRRPPGFASSSLDYKVGGGSAGYKGVSSDEIEKLLNPKPAKRKMQQPSQQEQETKQTQQQRQQKALLPTRAKGNYGPPPRQITRLEDLEHMTEEQIYRLFMEDPDLYRNLIKSTEEERMTSPTGPPAGANRARGGSRGKRNLQDRLDEDKQVPYFQWLVVLALAGLGLYQLYKSMKQPVKQKRGSVASASGGPKIKSGKQKKQKTKTHKSSPPNKLTMNQKAFNGALELPEKEKNEMTKETAAPLKRPSANKKKKEKPATHAQKEPQKAQNPPANIPLQNEGAKPSGASVPSVMQTTKEVVELEEDDSVWQTVAKTKGNKSETNNEKAAANNKSSNYDDVGKPSDNAVPEMKIESIVHPSAETKMPLGNGHPPEAPINGRAPAADQAVPSTPKKKKKKNASKKDCENEDIAKSTEPVDDVALAMQLQREEENLARAETTKSDLQEDAWEEVTAKKKKGAKA
jgi:hypothetical protein